MNNVWIETFTGKKFYFLQPRLEDIEIIDIAHSLSMQCRYCGHCRVFYSVAEHSVRVANIVPLRLRLAGLLHDAAEAYISDLSKPFKNALGSKIRLIEDNILGKVYEKFGVIISQTEQKEVKKADWVLLATESRDLMPNNEDWDLPEEPLPDKIKPWTQQEAKMNFLAVFYNECGRTK